MKKLFMPLLALVITLGLVIPLVTPTLAGQGDHFKAQFKGLGGRAYWSMYDEGTGVYTDVYIYTADEISLYPPGSRQRGHYANISISQYRYDADGYVPLRDVVYYGPVLPESLIVNRSLTSASLTASGLEGWQWDYATETGTAVTIDINVSWSATGPMSNYNDNSHYRAPYGFANYHSTGKSREASVLGEVVYDGTSATLEASAYASIFYAKQGSLDVIR